MKSFNCGFPLSDHKSRTWLWTLLIVVSLICGAYIIGNSWMRKDLFRLSPGFGPKTKYHHQDSDKCEVSSPDIEVNHSTENTRIERCNVCQMENADPLAVKLCQKELFPRLQTWKCVLCGDLFLRILFDQYKPKHSKGLLAIAVGIEQKILVNQIVQKFIGTDFAVMIFHYDGAVNEWRDLEWSNRVIHVSAPNQTKWWFAKRFLHPDIVAEYEYIFLWDEDLGVENFHPGRYISIVKEEGLEISQPALDRTKSEVHHPITIRKRRSRVHRRYYKFKGNGRCNGNNTAPPCVGWVEMMAPVFSRAAWRCAWYMLQNDLIHAWGLDMQLGYCAQGDRTMKVGVVDEEYIVHLGLPTLGGFLDNKKKVKNAESPNQSSQHSKNSKGSKSLAGDGVYNFDDRPAVRRQSYSEMVIFRKRWKKAVDEDQCWVDPFKRG